jgi:hypothetical protein
LRNRAEWLSPRLTLRYQGGMIAKQLNFGFLPQEAVVRTKACGVRSRHVQGGTGMRIPAARPLFAWDCLEDSPSLGTIGQFLEAVPDGELLESLRRWRGKGRDDYPISACWGVLLLTILLRHPTIQACLNELGRNAALRQLIGIDSEAGVPKGWNMTRFMDVLGSRPHLDLLHKIFDQMVGPLARAVADLGSHTAGDSSGLSCRRQAHKNKDGLPQPAGGRKEYTDESGNVVKVHEWFGYKFHLLVDVKHELALAYRITSPSQGDNEELPELVKQARVNLGDDLQNKSAVSRIQSLAYDKAADDNASHEMLDAAGIKAIIENRRLWKDDLERMLPGHDGSSNVVYDESGTLYCYDKISNPPVRHRMSYIGGEPSRGTLKYRCPAMHEGWKCPSLKRCTQGTYGKCVRVKREIDLRRFPAIPRATKQFERLYKGRTAVERVNGRIKVFWGADDGNITGAARFHALLGVVMVVHVGLATLLAASPRRQGTLGKMRLSPISKALQEKLKR